MGAFTLQAEIDEYGDLLDTALEECKRRGDACALAEAEYYSAKARACGEWWQTARRPRLYRCS